MLAETLPLLLHYAATHQHDRLMAHGMEGTTVVSLILDTHDGPPDPDWIQQTGARWQAALDAVLADMKDTIRMSVIPDLLEQLPDDLTVNDITNERNEE